MLGPASLHDGLWLLSRIVRVCLILHVVCLSIDSHCQRVWTCNLLPLCHACCCPRRPGVCVYLCFFSGMLLLVWVLCMPYPHCVGGVQMVRMFGGVGGWYFLITPGLLRDLACCWCAIHCPLPALRPNAACATGGPLRTTRPRHFSLWVRLCHLKNRFSFCVKFSKIDLRHYWNFHSF